MKIIISSQYVNDLKPDARRQIDYTLLFGGHSLEKLETIYKDLSLSIPFDIFYELYMYATKEKYNFLYCDVNNEDFRKNFNISLKIN